MRTLVGLAMTVLVASAAAYSFSPRSTPPLAPTRLAVDRMHLNALEPSSQGLVAAGELGHILVSTDQGSSWTKAALSHDRQALINQIAFAPDGKLGVAVGHEAWILKTEDGGLNWTEVAFAEQNGEPFLSVAQLSSGEWIVLGAFGRALRFNADLTNSQPLVLPEAVQDQHLNRIVASADRSQWLIVGERGLILTADANARDWSLVEPFYNGSFYNGVQLPNGDWLVYGMRGHAYLRQADGQWTRAQVPVPASFFEHMVLADGRVVLMGQGGLTLYSQDSGRSFGVNRIPVRASLIDAHPLGASTVLVASDAGLVSVELAAPAPATPSSGVSK